MMEQKIYDLFAKASRIARFWNPYDLVNNKLLTKVFRQPYCFETEEFIQGWVRTLQPEQLDEIEEHAVKEASLLFGSLLEFSEQGFFWSGREESLAKICSDRDQFEGMSDLLNSVGRGKDLKGVLDEVDQVVNAEESDLDLYFHDSDVVTNQYLAAVKNRQPDAWWLKITLQNYISYFFEIEPVVLPEVPLFDDLTDGAPVPEWLLKLATEAAQGDTPYDRVLAVGLICRLTRSEDNEELKRNGRLFWKKLSAVVREIVIRQALNLIDDMVDLTKKIGKETDSSGSDRNLTSDIVLPWLYRRDDLECISQLVKQSEEGQVLVEALKKYDDFIPDFVNTCVVCDLCERFYDNKLIDEDRFRMIRNIDPDSWWQMLDFGILDWEKEHGSRASWIAEGLLKLLKSEKSEKS